MKKSILLIILSFSLLQMLFCNGKEEASSKDGFFTEIVGIWAYGLDPPCVMIVFSDDQTVEMISHDNNEEDPEIIHGTYTTDGTIVSTYMEKYGDFTFELIFNGDEKFLKMLDGKSEATFFWVGI